MCCQHMMLFNANRSNKSNDAEPERPKPTEVANHAPRMDAKKAREVTFGLLLIHSDSKIHSTCYSGKQVGNLAIVSKRHRFPRLRRFQSSTSFQCRKGRTVLKR